MPGKLPLLRWHKADRIILLAVVIFGIANLVLNLIAFL